MSAHYSPGFAMAQATSAALAWGHVRVRVSANQRKGPTSTPRPSEGGPVVYASDHDRDCPIR